MEVKLALEFGHALFPPTKNRKKLNYKPHFTATEFIFSVCNKYWHLNDMLKFDYDPIIISDDI